MIAFAKLKRIRAAVDDYQRRRPLTDDERRRAVLRRRVGDYLRLIAEHVGSDAMAAGAQLFGERFPGEELAQLFAEVAGKPRNRFDQAMAEAVAADLGRLLGERNQKQ